MSITEVVTATFIVVGFISALVLFVLVAAWVVAEFERERYERHMREVGRR